jgi:hypothetical protein
MEEKFCGAPAIFANNDIKYDVNKRRAQVFATKTGHKITWVPAKDTPTVEALRDYSLGLGPKMLQMSFLGSIFATFWDRGQKGSK